DFHVTGVQTCALPISTRTPPLSPHAFSSDDAWGPSETDRAVCEEMLGSLTGGAIFSPPSRQGALITPSNIGGAHWGGVAIDRVRSEERRVGTECGTGV